jgi:hypothetical protein
MKVSVNRAMKSDKIPGTLKFPMIGPMAFVGQELMRLYWIGSPSVTSAIEILSRSVITNSHTDLVNIMGVAVRNRSATGQ